MMALWRKTTPFQPICYLILWGAALRLWIQPGTLPFDLLPGVPHTNGFYMTWLALGVVCPPQSLLAYWLVVHKSGQARYVGMWLRLGADIGMLTVMVTYHAAMALLQTSSIYAEGRIYSRYLTVAVMVQMAAWIAHDLYVLASVESHARSYRREGNS